MKQGTCEYESDQILESRGRENHEIHAEQDKSGKKKWGKADPRGGEYFSILVSYSAAAGNLWLLV